MAHIQLKTEQLPGIIGLMDYRPETGRILCELAEVLLRNTNTLTSGEREIIASSVSHWNDCHFCHMSHGAAAAVHFCAGPEFIDDIKQDLTQTAVTPKLRALLKIADKVRQGGKQVTSADITAAKEGGATDAEVHDTVLIAAAFCMYNRYVDGLGTWAPPTGEAYMDMGHKLAKEGYLSF